MHSRNHDAMGNPATGHGEVFLNNCQVCIHSLLLKSQLLDSHCLSILDQ